MVKIIRFNRRIFVVRRSLTIVVGSVVVIIRPMQRIVKRKIGSTSTIALWVRLTKGKSSRGKDMFCSI